MPIEATPKERAAVIWYLGTHGPNRDSKEAMAEFERIIAERGDEFDKAVNAHAQHLESLDRPGVEDRPQPERATTPAPTPKPSRMALGDLAKLRKKQQVERNASKKPITVTTNGKTLGETWAEVKPEPKPEHKPRPTKPKAAKTLVDLGAYGVGLQIVTEALMQVSPELQCDVLTTILETLRQSCESAPP